METRYICSFILARPRVEPCEDIANAIWVRRDLLICPNWANLALDDFFALMPKQRLRECELIAGHPVVREAARYFPNRSARFFTVWREPISHAILRYNWAMRDLRKEMVLINGGFEEDPNGADPIPFQTWFETKHQNPVCRLLITKFLGQSYRYRSNYRDDQLSSGARVVLKEFWLIAYFGRLEQSLSPLFCTLEIPLKISKSVNVAGRDYNRVRFAPEIEAAILERSKADLRLYEEFCGNLVTWSNAKGSKNGACSDPWYRQRTKE